MKHQKKIKSASRFPNVITVLMLLVGLALLLYPTVANKINEGSNHDAISQYQQQAQSLGQDEYQKILDAAKAYNQELFENTPCIGELTREKRKIYESLLNITGTGVIGYIEIDKPHIYLAIYHGTSESVLQAGVGHIEGSSLPVPGESVHTVLSGHSGLPSARLFTDLDQLEIGDSFILHVLNETLTYRVEKIQRVLPDTLKNLRIEKGQELCTLMTCTPYGVNTHRLVVTGRRIETPPENNTPTSSHILDSAWNRWFVLLPAVIFAVIVAAIVFMRKRLQKKEK